MKILALNPSYGEGLCKSQRWFSKTRGRVQRHPDYLCQAIAVLEEAGHECKFIDGAAKGTSFDETMREVKSFRPDLVVIQTTTPSIYSDIEYAKKCKEMVGCITTMVGAHVTAEPEDTLKKANGGLDAVLRGEYDYTLKDIADGKNIEEIDGVSYYRNGEVISNPDRPLIEDLDSLPYPAWHHIDPYDYHDAGKLYPFITLISGRGCEARCTFCLFPQVMYGRRYRCMSPTRVVDEIEYDFKLFPYLQEIMFEDDTLTLKRHRERLAQICEEICRRKLKITWSANARPDITELDILRLMKRAGCRMLVVGFEFGDQDLLNRVRKGITLEQMRIFTENCRKVGIRIHGCFMIGGPGETRETAMKTIKFAQSLKIDTVQFTGLCPYPGTEFYKWCKEKGYLVPQDWPEWVDKNFEQRAIINFPQLSVHEINELVDEGLKRFYLRPAQMIRMLKNISTLADLRTKIYGFKSFLDYFYKSSS